MSDVNYEMFSIEQRWGAEFFYIHGGTYTFDEVERFCIAALEEIRNYKQENWIG